MNRFTIVETMLGSDNYHLFEDLPSRLYDEDSQRFVLGFEPAKKYLETCVVLLDRAVPVGRFALYDNPNLLYQGKSTACVGSYECVDDAGVSSKLLSIAKEMAVKKGAKFLIGPMEGSTWEHYRFSAHNQSPNFFMEPYHHVYYNKQFYEFGFHTIHRYYSNLDVITGFDDKEMRLAEKELLEKGALIRSIDMSNLSEELLKIGRLSIEGFSENILFSPISAREFASKYEKLSRFFDPKLIWIIEDENAMLQAFVFAIKDHLDPSGSTVVIKSMVRRKDSVFKGVGKYLYQKVNSVALEMGFSRVIHAMMIEDNYSRVISNNMDVEEYKKYALYGMHL